MPVRHTLSATVQRFFPIWLGLLFLALLLKNPTLASDGVRRGLSLAAGTVIPSLFPSMLLSEWLMSAGAGRMRIPLLQKVGQIFGFSSVGMLCVLLGILCGSPVGARCAASAYRRGELSRSEYEQILPAASVPSPAFLIGTVGIGLLLDYRIGVLLYLCVLIAALSATLIQRKKGEICKDCVQKATFETEEEHLSVAALLVRSVKSATDGVLSVSAYILLFGTLCDVVCFGIGKAAPEAVRAGLLSLLELCGGMQACAALGEAPTVFFLLGATAGWSGLSVHVQVMSAGTGDGISYRPYLSGKALQALLCAVLFGVGMLFCKKYGIF